MTQETNTFSLPWQHDKEYYSRKNAAAGITKTPSDVPPLFQSLKIRDLTLRNRIVVSPMCQYSAADGFFNDWHLVHLGAFAKGGAGLIFTEATGVALDGRITNFCTTIHTDEHIVQLKRIIDFVHSQGSLIGVQLAHAGRKASTNPLFPIVNPHGKGPRVQINLNEGGWQPVGPSAIGFDEPHESLKPHALTLEQIASLQDDWVAAAKRVLVAGADVIEVHAAHGYLFHNFLSPVSNLRTDEYGGSFAGRIRFLLEVVQKVRAVWPKEKPLFVRLSATDWLGGDEDEDDSQDPKNYDNLKSWTVGQTVALSRILVSEYGVDVIDVSSGGNATAQAISAGPGYQIPFAERVRRAFQANEKTRHGLVMGVGKIEEAEQANEIIKAGRTDLVAIGRAFLRNPYWGLWAARTLKAEADWAPQMHLAKDF